MNHKSLLAVPMMLVLAGAAVAQNPTSPIMIRAGVANLTEANARDTVGRSPFAIGASYNFGTYANMPNATQWIDLDFLTGSRDGNRLNVYGLSYTVRFDLGQQAEMGFRPYIGAGVGVFQNEFRPTDGGGDFIASDTERSTRFGGKVVAGASLTANFGVEVGYFYSGKVAGARTDNWTIQGTYRF
jgi:opacity protein-like surface antigen